MEATSSEETCLRNICAIGEFRACTLLSDAIHRRRFMVDRSIYSVLIATELPCNKIIYFCNNVFICDKQYLGALGEDGALWSHIWLLNPAGS